MVMVGIKLLFLRRERRRHRRLREQREDNDRTLRMYEQMLKRGSLRQIRDLS